MKLVFGDLASKQRMIDAAKETDKFEAAVERAVMAMANFTNLPGPRAGIHDYPTHVRGYPLPVLIEAGNRIRQRRLR